MNQIFLAVFILVIVLKFTEYGILKYELKKRGCKLPCVYYDSNKNICTNCSEAEGFHKRRDCCSGCKRNTPKQDIKKIREDLSFERTARGCIIRALAWLDSITPILGIVCSLLGS